jgi:ketosteroid isomerase-like protein
MAQPQQQTHRQSQTQFEPQSQQRERPQPLNEETRIRKLLDQYARAFRERDLETMMKLYSSDVVAFDMMPPLKYDGVSSYREAWQKGLEMMGKVDEYETRDLKIAIDGSVAFSHCLNRVSSTGEKGPMDAWCRWTCCFRKQGDDWKIVHEHYSVPIEHESMKGMFDLRPQG